MLESWNWATNRVNICFKLSDAACRWGRQAESSYTTSSVGPGVGGRNIQEHVPGGENLLAARPLQFCLQLRFFLLSFCLSNLFRISNLGFRISCLVAASDRVRRLPLTAEGEMGQAVPIGLSSAQAFECLFLPAQFVVR